MSTDNGPYGLRPIYHPSGQVRPRVLAGGIASAYGTAILQYQPIVMASTGVIQAATATTDTIIGSFAGCFYTPSVNARPLFSNQWVASTTYVTGSMIAFFWDDPGIQYAVQADGSIAQTAIGATFDMSNVTAGNTTTGFSAMTMSATENPADGVLRVLDQILTPDNAWGDTYTQVRVQINKHPYVAPMPTI